jgi:hypothetical protein
MFLLPFKDYYKKGFAPIMQNLFFISINLYLTRVVGRLGTLAMLPYQQRRRFTNANRGKKTIFLLLFALMVCSKINTALSLCKVLWR